MREIQYNNAAFSLRFEFPSDWPGQDITGVTLGVKDTSGNELLAADACTLLDAGGTNAFQVNGAVEKDDNTFIIELAAGGSLPSPVPGDRLEIAASAAGPAEEVTVLHYNSVTMTVTTDVDLRYDHSDNTAVKGLFCTYDLDTSTVADWPKGRQVVLTWTPDTDDIPCKERGEIVISEFSVPGFNSRFSMLHPREYEAAIDPINRLPTLLQEAHNELRSELLLRGLNIDRVMDQEQLVPSLMGKVRWLVLLNGDDRYEVERAVAQNEYARQLELLSTAPIWGDDNQDEVRDSDEYEDHTQYCLERSL